MGGSVGFVGRARELSRVRAWLGTGAPMLLVVGDAGIGKTRFVAECLRAPADGGPTAVWGGCLPLAEKLPLLPIAEALGEFARLDGGRLLEGALDRAPGYARGEVERLLPQLGAAAAGGRGDGWRRERLFSAL